MAGKGRKPEGGVNWSKFYDNAGKIDWRKTIDCPTCEGKGMFADPHHGHGFKCSRCNGTGKIKEGEEPMGPSEGDNEGSED